MKTRKQRPRKTRLQIAVLPWRATPDGELEILLITSRETGRWVIPKGWPIKGLSSDLAACREAYEEAGLEGYAPSSPLGSYRYDKRLADGGLQPVLVEVFPMQVSEEHDDWPERDQRERRWFARIEAAALVDEPELRTLLEAFDPIAAWRESVRPR